MVRFVEKEEFLGMVISSVREFDRSGGWQQQNFSPIPERSGPEELGARDRKHAAKERVWAGLLLKKP
jgi:hypothetical protein